MTAMHRTWIVILAGLFVAAILGGCAKEPSEADVLTRGKELVEKGGCTSCHTPKVFTERGPVLDESRLFSGHPHDDTDIPRLDADQLKSEWVTFNFNQTCWVGPWGAAFAANLTPDMETGLGEWTVAMFIEAVRTGTHKQVAGAAHPMPWGWVGAAPDRDLKAMFVYLQSVEPVVNNVPPRVPIEGLLRED